MPVFFQKISESMFDANASFVVKESKGMHLVVGIFLLLFAGLAFNSFLVLSIFFGVAGIASIFRSRKNVVVMAINKEGFFYYGNLITNWSNFVSARFIDELPVVNSGSAGLSDQFFIGIRYYKDGRNECFERKIAFSNTQDKSEEEIFAAINFYYKQSQRVG